MLKFSEAAVVLAMIAAMASSARASTWATNGSLAFTTSNAGTSMIGPATCTRSTVSGTVSAGGSTSLPWLSAASVTPAFSSCSVSGVAGYSIVCSAATVAAGSYTGPSALPGFTGIATGRLNSVSCIVSAGATRCSTVTGAVPATYSNPTGSTTSGTLTIRVAGQALTVRRIGPGCAAIPDGVAQYGLVSAGVVDLPYSTVAVGTAAPNIVLGP